MLSGIITNNILNAHPTDKIVKGPLSYTKETLTKIKQNNLAVKILINGLSNFLVKIFFNNYHSVLARKFEKILEKNLFPFFI